MRSGFFLSTRKKRDRAITGGSEFLWWEYARVNVIAGFSLPSPPANSFCSSAAYFRDLVAHEYFIQGKEIIDLV